MGLKVFWLSEVRMRHCDIYEEQRNGGCRNETLSHYAFLPGKAFRRHPPFRKKAETAAIRDKRTSSTGSGKEFKQLISDLLYIKLILDI